MSLEDIQKYFNELCSISDFNGDISQLNFSKNPDLINHLNSQSDAKKNIYRHLVYENTYNVCQAAMPFTFEILGEQKIKNLIYLFYQNHKLKTHYYRIVPLEFLDFILKEKPEEFNHKPFLYELAEYEVAEFDLIYRKNENIPDNNPEILLEEAKIFLNPYIHFKEYRYPVHEINSENLNSESLNNEFEPDSNFIIQFRNPDDHDVYSLELSKEEFDFISFIQSQPNLTLNKIIEELIEKDFDSPEQILQVLQKLMNEKIILALI